MFHKCKNEADRKALFRRLAKKLHPDHGGEHELMILLQECYEIEIKKHEGKKGYDYEDLQREWDKRSQNEKKEPPKEKPRPKPFDGSYDTVFEDVYEGDERIRIIHEILAFSATHPTFDASFTLSVSEYLSEHGFITTAQFNALVKIYYAFKMDEQDMDEESFFDDD